MELGGFRAESVARHAQPILDLHPQRARRAGGPDAAVLLAERAGAGARRNFARLRTPVERERNVAAMAFTGDQHRSLSGASAHRPVPPTSRPDGPGSTNSCAAAAPCLRG